MAKETAAQGAARNGATRAIIIVGSLVLVALVGVIVALVMVVLNRGTDTQVVYVGDEPVQRTRVVNDDNVRNIVENLPETVDPGYYEVSMNLSWNFPDGASPSSNAFVENVATNTNDVYFDLQLRDTGETIYESPLIPLGEQLGSVTLDRNLSAGTYDCVIIYHLVDERQYTISTLSLGMQVIIES